MSCSYYNVGPVMNGSSQEELRELIKEHPPKEWEDIFRLSQIIGNPEVKLREVSFSGDGWFDKDGRFCIATNSGEKYKYKIRYYIPNKHLRKYELECLYKYEAEFLYN